MPGPTACTHARIGIIASKRVAPRAVDRNRAKRLVREVFRAMRHAPERHRRRGAAAPLVAARIGGGGAHGARAAARGAGRAARAPPRPAVAAGRARHGIATPHSVLRLLVLGVHAARRLAARPAAGAAAATVTATRPGRRRHRRRRRCRCRATSSRRRSRRSRSRSARAAGSRTRRSRSKPISSSPASAPAAATLRHLQFKKHRDTLDKNKDFVLFDSSPEHTYIAQSGLIGARPAQPPHDLRGAAARASSSPRARTAWRCG